MKPLALRTLLCLALLLSCGDSVTELQQKKTGTVEPNIPKGFESPDALGQAIVDAVGKPEAVYALFPGDPLLTLAAECAGENPIQKDIASKREKARLQLTELPPEMGAVQYEKMEEAAEAKHYKRGDTRENCSFKLPVVTQRYRHYARTTFKGRDRPLKEGVQLIKIGDYGWYLYSF